MDDHQFESIKQYVGFDEQSAALLRNVHSVVEPHMAEVIDDFYAAAQEHPTARKVITGGQAQIDRLKLTLQRWLSSVLLGPHDAAYLEMHQRIGRRHVQIALPQEYMFTAMNRIRLRLVELAKRGLATDPARQEATIVALHQALDLELAVIVDSYREDLMDKMRGAERREVAEAVPAFVLALDADGSVQLWNRALEQTTGLSRQEMLGQPGRQLIGSSGGDRKLPLKSGGHRVVRWRCAEPESTSGLTYAMGVDVSEEQLMQRRTLRAERLAAVGTLAAGLAHEVRNPLNSAILQLQVLRRRIERGRGEPGALLPVSEIVQDELRRLDRLVSDFLAFAQPRPLAVAATDINELARSVAELIKPEAASSGIRVVMDLDADAGLVDLDSERFRQVLLNLMRNGVEAMPSGGSLAVRTVGADTKGNIRLDVEDGGHGFDEDAPVFDAFYTTKQGGTGLGLAIVHRIVSDHGGAITVQSTAAGTSFSVHLPQRTAGPPAPAPRSSAGTRAD